MAGALSLCLSAHTGWLLSVRNLGSQWKNLPAWSFGCFLKSSLSIYMLILSVLMNSDSRVEDIIGNC